MSELETARVDWRMLFFQSLVATVRRPGRSAATAIGIALGIAVFLVTVGWSQTVSSQINQTFDLLAATKIVVKDTQGEIASNLAIPENTSQIVGDIPGVVSGGRLWVSGVEGIATSDYSPVVELAVVRADAQTLAAANVSVKSGRLYEPQAEKIDSSVVVLGASAARKLGITAITPNLSIQLRSAGTRALVVGILDSSGSLPELDLAVIASFDAPISEGNTVEKPSPTDTTAVIQVELGAANVVAGKLPVALSPIEPSRLGVTVPPEPKNLRGDVQESLDTLAYGAASLSLLIGGIGIMNSMLNAVSQRAGEIGLRRSMGAARHHIAVQFLIEGAFLGVVGAILGLVVGEVTLVAIAWINGWQPVLDQRLIILVPVAGLIIGTLASLYPAIRAASIRPSETLRA